MNSLKKLSILLLLLFAGIGAKAQSLVAIKTNLATDGFLTPNLGVEIGLAPKWSLDISGETILWEVNRHKWKHWMVQPEARYWFCDRFAGHFLGLHLLGGQYNFGNISNNVKFLGSDFSELTDYRFQGWAIGAGIGYGYSFILSDHFNLELEIGIGYMYTRYDKYDCNNCDTPLEKDAQHNYYGPTKLSIALEYLF